LAWRVIKTSVDSFRCFLLLFFILLVFVGGLFCLFLDQEHLSSMSQIENICLYILWGIALSFVFIFSFIECFNLGLCDKICRTNFQQRPLFGSRCQIVLVFSGALTLGFVLGLLVGLTDVRSNDSTSNKIRFNLVYSLLVGSILGGALGFFNHVLRVHQYNLDFDYQPIPNSHIEK
jgi:hypothetical protein